MIATFTVPGQPIPKGRARASLRRGRIHHHTPERTVAYEDAVGWAARAACGRSPFDLEGGEARPLAVSIVAVLRRPLTLDRPKSAGRPQGRQWATAAAGDADNFIKSILDGMQKSGALMDDRHVVDVRCRVVYAAQGEDAHAEVTVCAAGVVP